MRGRGVGETIVNTNVVTNVVSVIEFNRTDMECNHHHRHHLDHQALVIKISAQELSGTSMNHALIIRSKDSLTLF